MAKDFHIVAIIDGIGGRDEQAVGMKSGGPGGFAGDLCHIDGFIARHSQLKRFAIGAFLVPEMGGDFIEAIAIGVALADAAVGFDDVGFIDGCISFAFVFGPLAQPRRRARCPEPTER